MSALAATARLSLRASGLLVLSLVLCGCGGQFQSQANWGDDSLSGTPEDCTIGYQAAGELDGAPRVVLITIEKPDFVAMKYSAKLNADATIEIDGKLQSAPADGDLVVYVNGPDGSLEELVGDEQAKKLFAMGSSPSKQDVLDWVTAAGAQE